jgi:rod shape-determining protein MreC
MRQLTRRQRTAALTLAIVAVAFITLDLGGGSLRSSHSGVRGTLGSLYRGTDALLGPARRWLQGIPSAGSNRSKVDALQHQVAQLHAQLDARGADATTASELARLQLAANALGQNVVPARVVALGPGQGFDWTVTLDVGSGSGIRVGQTVTDGNGLVGRVLHADASTSVVLLAADPGAGVGVRDVRTGQLGVATGAGASGFTFVPLDPSADIRAGDQLVTGPDGSTTFVPGIAVGTVRSVRTSTDGTVSASVRPTAPTTQLDLVGVILLGGQPDASRPPLVPNTAQAQR